jgi:hypothetical protein
MSGRNHAQGSWTTPDRMSCADLPAPPGRSSCSSMTTAHPGSKPNDADQPIVAGTGDQPAGRGHHAVPADRHHGLTRSLTRSPEAPARGNDGERSHAVMTAAT